MPKTSERKPPCRHKVKTRKQAVAIALSVARRKTGGTKTVRAKRLIREELHKFYKEDDMCSGPREGAARRRKAKRD